MWKKLLLIITILLGLRGVYHTFPRIFRAPKIRNLHRPNCRLFLTFSSQYFSMRVGPILCHSCVKPISPEGIEKYNQELQTHRTVQFCCSSITYQSRAPNFKDGCILKAKPKKQRKVSGQGANPNPPLQPDLNS